jgi:hypothetical protein
MAKADNEISSQPLLASQLTLAQVTENAAYVASFGVKYTAQIAAHNEMLEKDGLWNDEFRAF